MARDPRADDRYPRGTGGGAQARAGVDRVCGRARRGRRCARPAEARTQRRRHDRDERHQPPGYRVRLGPQRIDARDVRSRDRRLPSQQARMRSRDLGRRSATSPYGCRARSGVNDEPPQPERIRQVEAQRQPESPLPEDIAAAADVAGRVIQNVARVIHAPRSLIARCVMGILCEGHVILEDFPGVGKTMLAKSLARSLDCEFARVQATPDLLPSDVTGVSVFNLQGNEFEFKPGPVFANLVLVDEINRASPKTQSALLECMQEVQVTVDGVTHPLARPFMVIATQNPIEYEGTFPLPEAQLDRFAMRLTLGYPSPSDEARMLTEHAADEPIEHLEPVASAGELEASIEAVKYVYVEESLNRYVVSVLRHTRGDARLALGASPRAGISLLRVAKANAVLRGREYVIPADVKEVAVDVLSHRVILAADARSGGLDASDVIREAVDRTPVPV